SKKRAGDGALLLDHPNRRHSMAMSIFYRRALLATVSLFLAVFSVAPQTPRTRHVVLVVTDGLRPEEVFTGADSLVLFGEPGSVSDTSVRGAFWRSSVEERRAALMPFLWGTIARQGQLFGNRPKGSVAEVTNGLKFSYPGYNEMTTGRADPRIRSNSF